MESDTIRNGTNATQANTPSWNGGNDKLKITALDKERRTKYCLW
jgi:hypothetical protein